MVIILYSICNLHQRLNIYEIYIPYTIDGFVDTYHEPRIGGGLDGQSTRRLKSKMR